MCVSHAFKLQALAVRRTALRGWGETKSFAELVFLSCELHGAGDGPAVWSTCYSSRGPYVWLPAPHVRQFTTI